MYSLQEVEQKLGVKSYVILFWENNFPQIGKAVPDGTERSYTDEDLEIFRLIQKYLYEEGLPMEEVQRKLSESDLNTAPEVSISDEEEGINNLNDESDKEFLEDVLDRLDEILNILKSSK